MKHFNYLKQLVLLPVVMILAALPSLAQLNGTYTVGGTSPNYATLTAAVTDLNTKGVSGPVTFNLRNGTYSEQVVINSVAGASAVNRITFKSETNNKANVTVTATGSSTANNYVFRLNNANYISLKDMTIHNQGSSYGAAVDVVGSSSFDSILNNELKGGSATNGSSYASPVYAYNVSGSFVVIKNNTILNGYTSVYLIGVSGVTAKNWVIENNDITTYNYAVMNQYTTDFKFNNNTITNSAGNTYYYGIYTYYSYDAFECNNNTMTISNGAYVQYALYNNYVQGSATNPSKRPKMNNNTINITNTTNTYAPVYGYYCNYLTLENNTVTFNSASTIQDMTFYYYCVACTAKNNTYNYTTTSSLSDYSMSYYANGCVMDGNTKNFNAPYIYAYNYYPANYRIVNNVFNYTATNSNSGFSISGTTSAINGVIAGNKFNMNSTSGGTCYGLYVTYPINVNIYNNVINSNTTSTNYGMNLQYPTNTNVYNNTVYTRGSNSGNAGYFYNSSSTYTLSLRNNIFNTTGTNYPLYVYGNAGLTSDYNNLIGGGTSLAQSSSPSVSATSLQAWRTGVSRDLNSISYDPGFVSTTNLAPDPANAAAWSLNGRGIQIAGNNTDVNGNNRSTTLVGGVPDIGAYEFTPTSTPPAAVANPTLPVANAAQYFTFGQDTTVVINWGPAVPSSISVRQYSGTLPAGINAVSGNNQYYYTDINVPSGTFDHTSRIYYKDPWMYTIGSEGALRLAKKDGTNPWASFTLPNSTVNVNRNIISTSGLTTFGLSTGIDASDNAGSVAVVNPTKPFCAGTFMVQAKVKNSGNNTLNSVQVNWSVDGTLQTPISYTTAIPTLGSGLGNEATINLGNVTFAATQRVIKVWTSAPNGITDAFPTDDTISTTLRSSLGGVYTIGGTAPDYGTIAAAISDLNAYGVCSAVTFNLRNGTYTAQAILKPALGMSAVNTVTFKSESNNAANVTVQFNAGSSNNYVFKIDSGAYYRIKLLTVRPTNSSYGRAFELAGTANNDSISDNLIPITATSSSTSAGLYAYYTTFSGKNNTFSGNTVTNGYYGAYVYGPSSVAGYLDSMSIIGNTFNTTYYYGVYSYYTKNLKINNNTITNTGKTTTFYGMYNYYPYDGHEVRNNTITIQGSSTQYGIQSYYAVGDASDLAKQPRFTGNTVSLTNTGTSSIYPVNIQYAKYDSVANNNFIVPDCKGYLYSYLDQSNSVENKIVNNTFNYTNSGSGYYIYMYHVYYGSNTLFENNTVNATCNNGTGYIYSYSGMYGGGAQIRKNTFNYSVPAGQIYNYELYGQSAAGVFMDNICNYTSTTGTIQNGVTYSYPPSYLGGVYKNNKITATSTSGTVYGGYIQYPNSFEYVNNVLNLQSNGTVYGMYVLYPLNAKFYNNTVSTRGTGTGYPAYVNANGTVYSGMTQNGTLRNNVLYKAQTSGQALYVASTAYVTSDFNNLFIANGTSLAGCGTPAVNATTLSQWRIGTGLDMNSIVHDPAFTSTTNLAPNPANANSWSLNGRGEHATFNNTDFTGATRIVSKAAGVPDIGAYEFTPTVAPPSAAVASGTLTAGSTQVFTLGQDTVAVVEWDIAGPVPSSIDVKQYSGTLPPPTFVTGGQMYLYTDINVPTGTYPHKTTFYYKDPQTGNTIGEAGLRLVKKVGTAAWTGVPAANTATNPVLNKNLTVSLNDFGFHTLTDVANNASAAELVEPVGLFCAPATKTIKVKIKNQGNNNLNSVQVGWNITVNGVTTNQTPVSYNSTIYTLGSSQGNEAVVTMGTYSFTNSTPIFFTVYTYSPNGVTDPAPIDDTLKFMLRPGLNGVYTIGGTTPDFPTVDSAITDINLFGICGPVTFNIRNGNYTIAAGKKLNGPIQGASVTNRVTFQSETKNANNVIITGSPTGAANNYVFGMAGVSDLSLKHLKFVNTNGTFSRVIDMSGAASRDSLVNCTFQANAVSSSADQYALIFAVPASGTGNYIAKDSLKNGGISIRFQGNSTNLIIDSNTILPAYYGPWCEGTNGVKFRGNNIVTTTTTYMPFYFYQLGSNGTIGAEVAYNNVNGPVLYYAGYLYYFSGTAAARASFHHNNINVSTTTYNYGIYTYYNNYLDIYNNDITINSTNTYGYGCLYGGYNTYLKVYNNKLNNIIPNGYSYGGIYFSNYNPSYSRYYNNVLNIAGGGTNPSYGLYLYPLNTDTVVNNTINMMSGATSSYAGYFYTYNGSNVMKNNIFSNYSGGPAMYWSDPYTGNISDYNNLYTNGTAIFSGTSTAASIQAYRTATGRELNSLSYDPGYVNASANDLHPDPTNPNAWSVNGRGEHLSWNNVDIEGNPRVTALADGVPDLGAYEFTPTSTPPLAVATPAVPAAGITQIFTFGQDTVAAIRWKAASVVPGNIEVRQYSGAKGPAFPAGKGFMYFYTDISTPTGSYDAQVDMFYKDPWRGIIPTEPVIRSVKQLLPNPWAAYNGTLSATNTTRNFITTNQVNDFGYFTGITDGDLFSSIILPGGSLVFCPGGSVTLNANVSGTGYTHQWSLNGNPISGATNSTYVATQAGTYTLFITSPTNQTATSNPILVTVVAPPSAQITANTALTFCPGGNLTLNVGTGPLFSYQWALDGNAITGATASSHQVTAAGSYTVTVKNIGCSTTSAPTSVSAGPMVVKLGSDTSFCQATPLVLDAGFVGAKYLWNTGDTTQTITIYNQSGLYSVQVDAGPNCADADTIDVQISPLPNVIGITYNKFGSTYQFSPAGATNVNSYLWLFSDGASDTARNVTHTFTTAEFEVKLVVFNDCGTDTAILQLPLDVSTVVGKDIKFSLYPNPAQTEVTLSVDGDVLFSEVTIVNNLGQIVHRGNSEGRKSLTIDVNKLIDGHYLIRANMSDGTIITKGFDVVK